ncbi:S16 family serine protease [Streptomyces sp. C11-1]|uniref:S16 family serine protease n=1 Tax=Streptomyces durocortorensis TaxID=2811104 RepID=A0ABY9VVX9_9ACTN|nr:S16 family serine protease [Streptomyces durocortorensis]WNF27314.1 S16 family serine protease [Streptomyces durocortorensis]
MLTRLSRLRALALCALPVLALFGTAALAPLPFTLARAGVTADVLGEDGGRPVITITGAETRATEGQLRMTTILATGPKADVRIGSVIDGWFRTDRAVMPRDSVYPTGGSEKEIEQHNLNDMKESQNVAVDAALNYLDREPGSMRVDVDLGDIGGPSAGLLLSLGIIDKLVGDGSGGDLTGGRTIAGTGTISADGKVGAVGGVSMKTQGAHRDGATVFLVPKAECREAEAERPEGLRLIPVTTLGGAVDSLKALEKGGKVPSC